MHIYIIYERIFVHVLNLKNDFIFEHISYYERGEK